MLRPLTDPVVMAALAVLLLNDHVLKTHWPSWLTGKLSDFAGLALFPVVITGCVSLVAPKIAQSRRLILSIVLITALGFSAAQLTGFGSKAYQYAWGALQHPFRLLLDSGTRLAPVEHTQDATDLLALVTLIIPWRLMRVSREKSAP